MLCPSLRNTVPRVKQKDKSRAQAECTKKDTAAGLGLKLAPKDLLCKAQCLRLIRAKHS